MTPLTLCSCELEKSKDQRRTDKLLAGITHIGGGDQQSDWWESTRYYQFYAGIAALTRPKRILEVGVRLGYSLVSMLRGFDKIERIVAVDNESGVKDSQHGAKSNIRSTGYEGELVMFKDDAENFATLVPEFFDLIHLDADHADTATGRDVVRAWTRLDSGGILIVDDTKSEEVRRGVEWGRRQLKHLEWEFYFPTFTGWWVARKQ